jgi:hypothetical protein
MSAAQGIGGTPLGHSKNGHHQQREGGEHNANGGLARLVVGYEQVCERLEHDAGGEAEEPSCGTRGSACGGPRS